MNQNRWKKFISGALLLLQLITGLSLSIANIGISYAQEGQAPKPTVTESFQVKKYLKAPGQGTAYFDSKFPIAAFVVQLINFLAKLIGSVAFLTIVAGGFMMIVSNGSEGLTTKGKDAIKYALIGIVISLSAFFITAFVQSIFYEVKP